MVQVIRLLDGDFIPELHPHFISRWSQSHAYAIQVFKFFKWNTDVREGLMIFYCMIYIKTGLLSLIWAQNTLISLQPHKLHSLYWTEWSYCSAVFSHGFSLPTFPGVFKYSAEICSMKQTCIAEHKFKRRILGVLRGVPPKWLGEKNYPQTSSFRFNEVFRCSCSC